MAKDGEERKWYLDLARFNYAPTKTLEEQAQNFIDSGIVPLIKIPTKEECNEISIAFKAKIAQARIDHPERFSTTISALETELERENRIADEKRKRREERQEAKRQQLSHSKEPGPKGFPQTHELEGPDGIHNIMQKRPPNSPFAPFHRQAFVNQEAEDRNRMFPHFHGWGPHHNLTRGQYCAQVSEQLKLKKKPTEYRGRSDWQELPACDQFNIIMEDIRRDKHP